MNTLPSPYPSQSASDEDGKPSSTDCADDERRALGGPRAVPLEGELAAAEGGCDDVPPGECREERASAMKSCNCP